MRKFETLLLLSPELAADAREALLGTFTGVIERAGGRFTADHWGMRDLAYPVRKQMRGYFVRLEYVAPGDTVAELERIIRISDGAFKFLTVKLADAAEEVARAIFEAYFFGEDEAQTESGGAEDGSSSAAESGAEPAAEA